MHTITSDVAAVALASRPALGALAPATLREQAGTEARDLAREQAQIQREIQQAQREAQRAQVEATRAQAEAAREAVRAQIEAARAAREAGQAVAGQPLPPLPPFPDTGPPEGVIIMVIGFFIAATVTAIGVPLARAFGRRIDRRAAPATEHPDTTARLERIEQAVEAIALEVERISEGQRFTNQVMNEMRALPAGSAPAEPLRQREREGTGR